MTFTCTDIPVTISTCITPTIHNFIHNNITLRTIINLMTTAWVIHTLGNPNRKVGAMVLEHGKKIPMALLGKGESRVLIRTLA